MTHADSEDSKYSTDLIVISNISVVISDTWERQILKGEKFWESLFWYFCIFYFMGTFTTVFIRNQFIGLGDSWT